MRSFRLLEIAAQAEAVRLRRGASGMARSAVLHAAATVFGLAALGLLHVAGWIWLAGRHDPLTAALVLALVDVVAMGLLLAMARPRYDPVAVEALRLRRQSLAEASRISPLQGLASMFASRQTEGRVTARGLAGDIGAGLLDGVVRGLTRR